MKDIIIAIKYQYNRDFFSYKVIFFHTKNHIDANLQEKTFICKWNKRVTYIIDASIKI